MLAGSVTLIGLVGCSADKEAVPQRPSASATPKAATTTPPPKRSAAKASGIGMAHIKAEVANAQGGRAIELKGGVRKGPLGIGVICTGEGTMRVTYNPAGLSFPLDCSDKGPGRTYNQIDLSQDREIATMTIEAPSTVRWAMTVGQD